MSGLPFTGFVVPSGGGSSGGVTGLTSADGGDAIADNEVIRGDGTTGIQGSVAILSDAGALSALTQLDVDNIRIDGNTLSSTDANGNIVIAPNGSGKIVTGGSGTAVHIAFGAADIGLGTHATTSPNNLHALEADLGNWISLNALEFYLSNTGMHVGQDAGKLTLNSDAGVLVLREDSATISYTLSSVLVEANTAGSGAPNVITALESSTVFTNEGTTAANYHTLPTAVAGYAFEFIVQDADGIRIVANTDDTIRVIDKVTAAAGYIESTTIGSTVRLVSINAVEWFATSIHGVWTDGTFTFDDTGSTSP